MPGYAAPQTGIARIGGLWHGFGRWEITPKTRLERWDKKELGEENSLSWEMGDGYIILIELLNGVKHVDYKIFHTHFDTDGHFPPDWQYTLTENVLNI